MKRGQYSSIGMLVISVLVFSRRVVSASVDSHLITGAQVLRGLVALEALETASRNSRQRSPAYLISEPEVVSLTVLTAHILFMRLSR